MVVFPTILQALEHFFPVIHQQALNGSYGVKNPVLEGPKQAGETNILPNTMDYPQAFDKAIGLRQGTAPLIIITCHWLCDFLVTRPLLLCALVSEVTRGDWRNLCIHLNCNIGICVQRMNGLCQACLATGYSHSSELGRGFFTS